MSREVIRNLHGMVARRVIGAISKDTVAYIGEAAAFSVDGVDCIVMANDSLALKKLSEHFKLKVPFELNKVSRVSMTHCTAVTLADTGWEKQLPIQPDDWDEDDEL